MSFFVSKDIEKIVDENCLTSGRENVFSIHMSQDKFFDIKKITFYGKNKINASVFSDGLLDIFLKQNIAFKIIFNQKKYSGRNIIIKSIEKKENNFIVNFDADIEEQK